MLNFDEIRAEMLAGNIEITPLPHEESFGSNSVDLRLGHEIIDMSTKDLLLARNGKYNLQRLNFYLGSTLERIKTSNSIVVQLHGRSSAARMGLFSHLCAGFGDIGFQGSWTLELFPVADVKLAPGDRIVQASFHRVKADCSKIYNGHYSCFDGPKESKGL